VVHLERDSERARFEKADPDLGSEAFIDARAEEFLEFHLRRCSDEGPSEFSGIEACPPRSYALNIPSAENRNGLNRGDNRPLKDFGVGKILESQDTMDLVVIESLDVT
jgi:hypothetical protein